jgi:hypothetical protein
LLNIRDCELMVGFHAPLSSKTTAVLRCLRVMHDAPDYFAVAISHIVIIRRPPLAPATFASFDENKLNLANPPLEYSPARSTKAQKLSVMLDHGRIEFKVPLENI